MLTTSNTKTEEQITWLLSGMLLTGIKWRKDSLLLNKLFYHRTAEKFSSPYFFL
jgi:hypothetical protein